MVTDETRMVQALDRLAVQMKRIADAEEKRNALIEGPTIINLDGDGQHRIGSGHDPDPHGGEAEVDEADEPVEQAS